ncbi:hypothetical protein SAMN05421788_10375 [Filimonas lacunae]|uniref:Dolichyl-phosphate-mannose-protein mannosyltransferase n=1 Tax=Filimonas lacunae TaxID=477680 RepID=A0A173MJB7_9BACT|nr:hypothetical protein [Filimonas lacunae]BAV07725.1 hypothetical protein FLA_3756 [Filimonas lacunae]SIT04063.1 hypothetical protein SAMN05421788_10375 [Filimonas lacunae]
MEKNALFFISFIWHNKLNRIYLLSVLLFTTIGWVVFKYLYPNPNVIFDSYYYITAAVADADVNAWPIGYSRFLRLVGLISHSVNWLLTLQHLLLNLALLYFFFTLRYLFLLGKKSSIVLLILLFANPIFPYVSNLVLSDSLFTALSLTWLSQLLWIIYRPRPYMLVTHALLLLFTFTVRYNALYYPFIAALAFILSRQALQYKLGGIVLQFLLLGIFITYTTHRMKQQYKVAQFSPFGGWKLANDALYIYEHVYQANHDTVPDRFKALDDRVREYFSKRHYQVGVGVNDPTWGSFYMYIHPSPLIQHMFSIYGKDAPNINLNFQKFALMGPLYQDYGVFIIKKYPIAFVQHFVLPNVGRYFYPPQEVLVDSYNPFALRKDYLGKSSIEWFGLQTLEASGVLIQFRTILFSLYPVFTMIIHLLFLFTAFNFLFYKVYRRTARLTNYVLLTIGGLWLFDFGFSIVAAAIVLRYQLFIMVVELGFSLVFSELYFWALPQQAIGRHSRNTIEIPAKEQKVPFL